MRRNMATLAGMGMIAAVAFAGDASADTLNQLTSVQIVGNVPFDYQLQTARKLGVRRVRLAAYWPAVEKPRGRFIWRSTDARIGAVLKAGMAPIIVLYGANGGYPSPDGGKAAPPSQGEALEGFARFAAATAARYGVGRPDMPILYEIWNEPNTKTFWKRIPDPEGYARMAEAACKAIRTSTPQARVLALGMEGWPVKTPYRVAAYDLDIYQQWAGRAASPGLMACADGISFHPYLPRPEQVLQGEPRLQGYLARVWRRASPPLLANTEWGYPINAKKGVDASMQAALDLRALLIGTGLGRVTNLYQSVDGGRDATRPDQTYGLVTADGAFKQAGLAVQRLLRLIGDYDIDGVSPMAGQPNLYSFTAHRGAARARIVWAGGEGKPAMTTVLPKGAEAIDLVTGAPAERNGDKVVIGANPVLLSTGAV